MILHIGNNLKFLRPVVANFETVAPGLNRVWFCGQIPPSPPLGAPNMCRTISRRWWLSPFYPWPPELKQAKFVVLHSMTPLARLAVPRLRCPVLWIGYGSDYYPLICRNDDDLLLPLTQAARQSALLSHAPHPSVAQWLKQALGSAGRRLLRYTPDTQGLCQMIANRRITYFSPRLESEYSLARANCPTAYFPPYVRIGIGVTSATRPPSHLLQDLGNDILIGNSASWTNNHLDIFALLQRILPQNQFKLVTPLSYGSSEVRQLVITVGQARFGKDFVPLNDYLPLAQYWRLIQSCGYIIMNHLRQQAYGNIAMGLYIGAKVFLDERNPLYTYLVGEGYHLSTIQQLSAQGLTCLTPLREEEKDANRRLAARTSLDKIVAQTASVIRQACPDLSPHLVV
jgi:hypothetical protein